MSNKLRYHTITTRECDSQCQKEGCERFICWQFENLVANPAHDLVTIVIFNKTAQVVMLPLLLTPLSISKAFREIDESHLMFVSAGNETVAFVSLRWILANKPPKDHTAKFKDMEKFIMNLMETNHKDQATEYLCRKLIGPSSNSIN